MYVVRFDVVRTSLWGGEGTLRGALERLRWCRLRLYVYRLGGAVIVNVVDAMNKDNLTMLLNARALDAGV